jgi:CRP-like cAMP-binding protein
MTDFGPVEETAQERAARLLVTPGALVQLSLADAREVVRYLQPRRLPAGTVFIRAGESRHTGYLLLIIEGEVTVESPTVPGTDSLVVSVVGPGSLIGEMGLIDGSPRSATCTAATDLGVGLLTREALAQLIDDLPAVAARLLLAIAKRLSDHVRDANRKVLTMTQLNRALQQELDAAHSVNKRLLYPRG